MSIDLRDVTLAAEGQVSLETDKLAWQGKLATGGAFILHGRAIEEITAEEFTLHGPATYVSLPVLDTEGEVTLRAKDLSLQDWQARGPVTVLAHHLTQRGRFEQPVEDGARFEVTDRAKQWGSVHVQGPLTLVGHWQGMTKSQLVSHRDLSIQGQLELEGARVLALGDLTILGNTTAKDSHLLAGNGLRLQGRLEHGGLIKALGHLSLEGESLSLGRVVSRTSHIQGGDITFTHGGNLGRTYVQGNHITARGQLITQGESTVEKARVLSVERLLSQGSLTLRDIDAVISHEEIVSSAMKAEVGTWEDRGKLVCPKLSFNAQGLSLVNSHWRTGEATVTLGDGGLQSQGSHWQGMQATMNAEGAMTLPVMRQHSAVVRSRHPLTVPELKAQTLTLEASTLTAHELQAGDMNLKATTASNQGLWQAKGRFDFTGEGFNNEGVLRAGQLTLTATDAHNARTLEGASLHLTANKLTNRAQIQGRDLTLKVKALDNTGGRVQGAGSVTLDTDNQTLTGHVHSEGDMTLHFGGDYQHQGTLKAGGHLRLKAGNLINRGSLQAQRQLSLTLRGSVTNEQELMGGEALSLEATDLSNHGLIDAGCGEIRLRGHLDNHNRLYGDSLRIGAGDITNLGTVATCEGPLTLAAHTLNNRPGAWLYSAGDLHLAHQLGDRGATGRMALLSNTSGTISAEGNIHAQVDSLRQAREHLQLVWGDEMASPYREHERGFFPWVLGKLKKHGTVFTKEERLQPGSVPARLEAGGNVVLVGEVHNNASDITAGGYINYGEGHGSYHGSTVTGKRSHRRQGKIMEYWQHETGGIFETGVFSHSEERSREISDNEGPTYELLNPPLVPARLTAGGAIQGRLRALENRSVYQGDEPLRLSPAKAPVQLGAEDDVPILPTLDLSLEQPRFTMVKSSVPRTVTPPPQVDLPQGTAIEPMAMSGPTATMGQAVPREPIRPAATSTLPPRAPAKVATLSPPISKSVTPRPMMAVTVSMPRARLTGALFKREPSQPKHVVEADPAFTRKKNFLSSEDYLARQPARGLRRLGDGFVEQRLVREQIMSITHRGLLPGYGDSQSQFQALMEAGVQYQRNHDIAEGVALSAKHMAALDRDMVRMVQEQVPTDRGLETVWVPKVYLRRPQAEDLQPDGGLIMAGDINLRVAESVMNQGTVHVEGNLALEAKTLENRGDITAKHLALGTEGALKNLGGHLEASDSMSLEAGTALTLASLVEEVPLWVDGKRQLKQQPGRQASVRAQGFSGHSGTDTQITGVQFDTQEGVMSAMGDLRVESLALREEVGFSTSHRQERHASVTHQPSRFQGTEVALVAQGDLSLGGVHLEANNAFLQGASVQVVADLDRTLEERREAWVDHWHHERHDHETTQGGSFQVGTDMGIHATEGGIDLQGVQIDLPGTLAIKAPKSIAVTAMPTRHEDMVETRDTQRGVFADTSAHEFREDRVRELVGSVLQAGHLSAHSRDSKVQILASQLHAKHSLGMEAQAVEVGTQVSTEEHRRVFEEETSGLWLQGGIHWGERAVSDEREHVRERELGSTLVSEDSITLLGHQSYHQLGSALVSEGRQDIEAGSVHIEGGHTRESQGRRHQVSQSGLSITTSSPVMDWQGRTDTVARALDTTSGTTQAAAVASAALGIKNTLDTLTQDPLSVVSLSFSLGDSSSEVHQSSQDRTITPSLNQSLQQDIHIEASQGHLTLAAARVEAKGHLSLSSAGDTELKALWDRQEGNQESSSSGSRSGLELSLGGIGLSAGTHQSDTTGSHQGQQAVPTLTQSATLSVDSHQALRLQGSRIKAQDATINVGTDLEVEALGDESWQQSHHEQQGVNSTLPLLFSQPRLSLQTSHSDLQRRIREVKVPSGVELAGKLEASVQGHTHLKGATIQAGDPSSYLHTQSLTLTEVHNDVVSQGQQVGLGLSYQHQAGWQPEVPMAMQIKHGDHTTTPAQLIFGGDKAESSRLNLGPDMETMRTSFDVVSGLNQEVGAFLTHRAKEAERQESEARVARSRGDVEQAERLEERAFQLKNTWGPGGLGRQGLTALTGGLNQNALGTNLAQGVTASLAQQQLATQVGRQVQQGGLMEGSALHATAHAAVGATGAWLAGQDPTSGALGGATSSLLTNLLPEDDASPLGLERQSRLIGALSTLAAANTQDPATASHAATVAGDNNHLVTKIVSHLIKKGATETGKQSAKQAAKSSAKKEAQKSTIKTVDKKGAAEQQANKQVTKKQASKGTGRQSQDRGITQGTEKLDVSPHGGVKSASSKPKGVKHPKVRESRRKGMKAHKEFREKVEKKPGWEPGRRFYYKDSNGRRRYVVPDAFDPKGRPVELKPRTPSGIKKGKQQLDLYKKVTGKNGRVVYYDPGKY